jgi:hypothetical protein
MGDDILVWDIPTLISVTMPNLAGFHVVDNPPRDCFQPLLSEASNILLRGTSVWQ